MRRSLVTPAVFALIAVTPVLATAQGSHSGRRTAFLADDGGHDGDRAVLGIDTRSGSLRDSLGLLVTDVTPGGPADKAGIEEGDRIVSANGIDLRLSAADAADHEMAGLMARRLAHAIGKLKVGDVVELRVYHNGQITTTRVTTAKASDVFTDGAMLRFGALGADAERGLREATASLRLAMPRHDVELDAPGADTPRLEQDLGPLGDQMHELQQQRDLTKLQSELQRMQRDPGAESLPPAGPLPRHDDFMIDAGPHRI